MTVTSHWYFVGSFHRPLRRITGLSIGNLVDKSEWMAYLKNKSFCFRKTLIIWNKRHQLIHVLEWPLNKLRLTCDIKHTWQLLWMLRCFEFDPFVTDGERLYEFVNWQVTFDTLSSKCAYDMSMLSDANSSHRFTVFRQMDRWFNNRFCTTYGNLSYLCAKIGHVSALFTLIHIRGVIVNVLVRVISPVINTESCAGIPNPGRLMANWFYVVLWVVVHIIQRRILFNS